jgi:hypothetical protein
MMPQMIGAAMGGQEQGAPPQQVMLQPMDPFLLLNQMPKIKIMEKMNMMETATGLMAELMGVDMELEMANKYVIQTMEGHNLFFAVEQTDFCNRQCGGDCRGIDVDVVVLGQDPRVTQMAENQFDWSFNPLGKVDLGASQKFMKLHKDCQCTCCCFNRPIIDVVNETSGQLIGKIKDPWACCDMTFELMDPQGEPLMTAKGGCCQLGLICPCPCGPCNEVNFSVNDAKTGQEVGHLKKIIPGCMSWIVADDVDNYEVDFGQVQHPEWKAMLIALSLFIDFRYFNTRSDKNDEAVDAMAMAAMVAASENDLSPGLPFNQFTVRILQSPRAVFGSHRCLVKASGRVRTRILSLGRADRSPPVSKRVSRILRST